MLRLNIVLIMCLFLAGNLTAQVTPHEGGPCGGDLVELTTNGTSYQSSTDGSGIASKAIDGVETGNWSTQAVSRTLSEINPWWEVDLGDGYNLNNIKIQYSSDVYPNGLGNYYILVSNWPFETTSLSAELASPLVESIHVNNMLPSGAEIPLSNQTGQYLRIQLADEGVLSFLEIDIPGGGNEEICGNGEDDDCDGKTDCEDSDCAPMFAGVEVVQPTCPICDDGKIIIQQTWDIDYVLVSIDGTDNFGSCNNNSPSSRCRFEDLPEGEYDLFLSNGECTVEYSNNPVVLAAPRGGATGHCLNGDFEEGDFSEWTGRYGTRNGTNNIWTNGFDLNDQHTIIPSSNLNDPIAGEDIPLSSPNDDLYFAKIGAIREGILTVNNTNGLLSELTYCFIVDDENNNFNFNYAFVLEDGDNHSAGEQPFFQWRLLDSQGNVIDPGDKFIGDTDNEVLESSGDFVWQGWSCVNRNLQNLGVELGEEVCVEFLAAGCSSVRHFGYAYIDGLCTDPSQSAPSVSLEVNKFYCQNQQVIFEANSQFHNQFQWEVCRLLPQGVKECHSTELITQFTAIPPFDVFDFFFNDQNNNVAPLECDDTFEVTLTTFSSCDAPMSSTHEFTYLCEDGPFINYPDIIYCGDVDQDIQIQGTVDCGENECDFEWSYDNTSFFLNNLNIPFPTVLGSTNLLALQETYNVVATNDVGCIAEDEMMFIEVSETMGSLEIEIECISYCTQRVLAHVTFDMPVSSDEVSRQFKIKGTDIIDLGIPEEQGGINKSFSSVNVTGQLVSPSGISTTHTFEIPELWDTFFEYEIKSLITIGNLPVDSDYFIQDGCGIWSTHTIPHGLYHGKINLFMPNVFSPNGDGANDLMFPNFSSNVIQARVQYTDRWGGIIWCGDALTSTCEGPGLTGIESGLTWNGHEDNTSPPGGSNEVYGQAVYAWQIAYGNCDVAPSDCVDDDCDGNSEDENDVQIQDWVPEIPDEGGCPWSMKGDFTLVL